MPKRYPLEQREGAVRMVLGHLDEYRSVYSACQVIGPKLGIGAESLRTGPSMPRSMLRRCPERAPRSKCGSRNSSVRTAEQMRIKELEREDRELEEVNEILKSVSIFFARELDPRRRGGTSLHRRCLGA